VKRIGNRRTPESTPRVSKEYHEDGDVVFVDCDVTVRTGKEYHVSKLVYSDEGEDYDGVYCGTCDNDNCGPMIATLEPNCGWWVCTECAAKIEHASAFSYNLDDGDYPIVRNGPEDDEDFIRLECTIKNSKGKTYNITGFRWESHTYEELKGQYCIRCECSFSGKLPVARVFTDDEDDGPLYLCEDCAKYRIEQDSPPKFADSDEDEDDDDQDWRTQYMDQWVDPGEGLLSDVHEVDLTVATTFSSGYVMHEHVYAINMGAEHWDSSKVRCGMCDNEIENGDDVYRVWIGDETDCTACYHVCHKCATKIWHAHMNDEEEVAMERESDSSATLKSTFSIHEYS